jgi:hypothetical protein
MVVGAIVQFVWLQTESKMAFESWEWEKRIYETLKEDVIWAYLSIVFVNREWSR